MFKRKKEEIRKERFTTKRDNLQIVGEEYRKEGSSLPIAIVSHGFMANMSTTRGYAKYLAELGYCAYCFDFCGGSIAGNKSDGKTTEMSALTEVQDLEAVIRYAKSRAYTDENAVLLMGCSQGGFVSGIVAGKNREDVKQLILFYPALCIPDDARSGSMMNSRFDPLHVPETFRCGPMKLGRRYAEDVNQLDPYELLEGYEKDVLIVHGNQDKIVNISYSNTMIQRYRSKGLDRKCEYCVIDKAGHGFKKKEDVIAREAIWKFVG